MLDEVREEIIRTITSPVDMSLVKDGKELAHMMADQLLAIIKKAGYRLVDEEAELPKGFMFKWFGTGNEYTMNVALKEAGWVKKVIK